MRLINQNQESCMSEEMMQEWEASHRRGKIFGGLLVIGAGVLFLLKEMGAWLPSWIFTWQMFLIVLGLYVGVKHAFRRISWLILVAIGSAFMVQEFYPDIHIARFVWPVVIILVGIGIILKPKRREKKWKRWAEKHKRESFVVNESNGRETIDVNSVFGSVERHVTSKNFQGGEINAVFGGAEINLMDADFTGVISLDINVVFGGTRLIMPASWIVKSELNAVAGSVEDKRPIQQSAQDDTKRVILTGNAVFGGLEIQSY